jgi:hypothetical protein
MSENKTENFGGIKMSINKIERMKESQKKLNSAASIMAFIICMFLVVVLGKLYFTYGRTVDTELINLFEPGITVNADNSAVEVKGTTVSSAQAFVRHKYKIKDDVLYLKLCYALAINKNRSGEFDITITDDLSNINTIYLQGKSRKDLKLLWERK